MNWGYVLCGLCVVIVLLPCRFDPAIRLKYLLAGKPYPVTPRPDRNLIYRITWWMKRDPSTVRWCTRQTQRGVFGTRELWMDIIPAWVRLDDLAISQPLKGTVYPTLCQRWKLRRAIRRFERAYPNPLPLLKEEPEP